MVYFFFWIRASRREWFWETPTRATTTGMMHGAWTRSSLSWWEPAGVSKTFQTILNTGWWSGTFLIFPNSWDDDLTWLIFFRGVEATNQILNRRSSDVKCIPDCSCLYAQWLPICVKCHSWKRTVRGLLRESMCYMLRVHYPCQGLVKLYLRGSFWSLFFFPHRSWVHCPID